MAVFLNITAFISVVTGYGAYRLGWINRSPHIRWTLLSSYALSSLLTFLNVWVTARLMFASQHDLLLGSAIAKEAVQAHGGYIGVESQPGQGTRFFFTLPRS